MIGLPTETSKLRLRECEIRGSYIVQGQLRCQRATAVKERSQHSNPFEDTLVPGPHLVQLSEQLVELALVDMSVDVNLRVLPSGVSITES